MITTTATRAARTHRGTTRRIALVTSVSPTALTNSVVTTAAGEAVELVMRVRPARRVSASVAAVAAM